MRNAHARLIGTAGVMVAGAVLRTATSEKDLGGAILGMAGFVWVIEYLVMVIVPERKPRQD